MLPLQYESSSQEERKEVVSQIANGLRHLNTSRHPKIALTIKAGNTKKNQLLNLIITQMYNNDFDVTSSFLAVEENI